MDELGNLNAYLPMEVRRAIIDQKPLPTRTIGAAVFADMSGFTELSHGLAEELGEAQGAERLTLELDGFFNVLVSQIQLFHGSVIGFSGDAVTCWFDESLALTETAVLRSTSAALAIQRIVETIPPVITPAGEKFPIKVKLAIAYGKSRRFIVGDPEIQKFEVFAGTTLEEMAAAEQLATGGEVVVTTDVLAELREFADVEEMRESDSGVSVAIISKLNKSVQAQPWAQLSDIDKDKIRPWVLQTVREHADRGESEYIAAFRPVESLFIQFSGIDYDEDDSAGEKLQLFVQSVQRILVKFHGHLVDITIGDKGSYLCAAFGALHAIEDGPRYATAAALELRKFASEFEFIDTFRMGISQCRAYAGAYGCPKRKTFGVVGDQVNIAARLMTVAQNAEILVTPFIAQETEGLFEFRQLKPALLKGLTEPMTPRAVIKEIDLDTANELKIAAASKPIGREKETQLLEEFLEGVERGQARNILLQGEPGMGKSILLAYAVQVAETRHLPIVFISSDAIQSKTPYFPWRGVFENCFASGTDVPNAPRLTKDGCLARLQELTPEDIELAPLLNSVLGLDYSETSKTQNLEGQIRLDATSGLMKRILEARHTKTTLIILEDLHWFDSASVALLDFITLEMSNVFVLATRRPVEEDVSSRLRQSFVSRSAVLNIERLDSIEISALVSRNLGVSSIPEAVQALVESKAEGNPFFSQQIALALRDSGQLEVIDGRCRVDPNIHDLAEIDFPSTIQGVIASRLDNLPMQQQLPIKVASVIGRNFAYNLLHDVYPIKNLKHELLQCLQGYEEASLTVEQADLPELIYLFQHILTQEVAYDMLVLSQRLEIHRAITEWYETSFEADLAPHYGVLAHHMAIAASGQNPAPSVLGKALDYLDKAGHSALVNHSNLEAVQFFTTAIELDGAEQSNCEFPIGSVLPVEKSLRLARWSGGLSRSYFSLGDLLHCKEESLRSLKMRNFPVPETNFGLILGTLGQIFKQACVRQFRIGPGRNNFSPILKQELAEVNELRWILSKVYYHESDPIRPMYLNMHGLNLSEKLGPTSRLGIAYTQMLLTLGVFKIPSWAMAYSRLSLDIARTAGHPGDLAMVLVNHGVYFIGLGEWQEAISSLEEARAMAEDYGDYRLTGEGTAIQADVALFQGDLVKAQELYSRVHDSARRADIHMQKAWCLRPQLVSSLREGKPEKLLEIIEENRSLWEYAADLLTRLDIVGLRALARFRVGDQEGAVESAEAAMGLMKIVSPPVAYPGLLGYSSVAEACLNIWLDSLANTTLQTDQSYESLAYKACKSLQQYASTFPIGRPAAKLNFGWYYFLKGNSKKGLSLLLEARELADTLGMDYECGRANLLIARYGTEGKVNRMDALKEAEALFGKLGASYDLEQSMQVVLSE